MLPRGSLGRDTVVPGVSDLRGRLAARAAWAGVPLPVALADRLLAYFQLLARWNARINLTAFDLSAPTDEALDRLLLEPVRAARMVRDGERRAIDIGSGGGSPAVPLALAAPWIEMTMVEVRAKKAAFLREVARTVPARLRVEARRVEDLARSGEAGRFELATLRAVRADAGLWAAVDELLAPGGRVFWFGGIGQPVESGVFEAVEQADVVAVLSRR